MLEVKLVQCFILITLKQRYSVICFSLWEVHNFKYKSTLHAEVENSFSEFIYPHFNFLENFFHKFSVLLFTNCLWNKLFFQSDEQKEQSKFSGRHSSVADKSIFGINFIRLLPCLGLVLHHKEVMPQTRTPILGSLTTPLTGYQVAYMIQPLLGKEFSLILGSDWVEDARWLYMPNNLCSEMKGLITLIFILLLIS